MFRHIAFALGVSLAAPAAMAQTAAAPEGAPAAAPAFDAAAAYQAARNQLGILKYCAEAGHTGADAIAAQEKMIGMLPEGDVAAGDTAEAKGAEGTVSIGGTDVVLSEAVTQQGTTVDAQCKQIEAAVNQVAAQLPG